MKQTEVSPGTSICYNDDIGAYRIPVPEPELQFDPSLREGNPLGQYVPQCLTLEQ